MQKKKGADAFTYHEGKGHIEGDFNLNCVIKTSIPTAVPTMPPTPSYCGDGRMSSGIGITETDIDCGGACAPCGTNRM
jgi:hypothetical protein